jgi:hypothetical protein
MVAREEIGVKRYAVRLSADERAHLEAMLRKGKHAAKTLLKARILLKADVSEAGEGLSDGAIIAQMDTNASMVCRARKQLVEEGIDAQAARAPFRAADFRRREGSQADRLDLLGSAEGLRALDVAAAREESRRARHRRGGERQHDRSRFKKNILKPHRKQQWVIPPQADAGFVAAMEDALEVYQRPHDPARPVVCIDETTKQPLKERANPSRCKEAGRNASIMSMSAMEPPASS